MSVWGGIAVLAVGTLLLRTAAPAALARLGGPRLHAAVTLIAPALLAALIGISTFAAGRALVLDARAAGVAVAAVAAARRLPLPLVITLAVATTALLRAAG